MKASRTNLVKGIKRLHIANLGILMVVLICIILFMLSPFSPIHAASTPEAWDGNFVSYKIGDVVSYDGNNYKCIQAHTSEPNWNPVATADLWTLQPSNTVQTDVTPTPTPTPTSVASTSMPTPTPTPTSVASTSMPTLKSLDAIPTVVTSIKTQVEPPPPSTNQPSGSLVPVSVTFYTDQGPMADGNQTHTGACAVWTGQFPLGTMIKLYNPDNLNQAVYSCTAEDTGTHICDNDIDVAMPGQITQAIQLGVKQMELQVVGFDQVVALQAVANHPSSQGCELGATH